MKKIFNIIAIVIATFIFAGCSDKTILYSWEEDIDADWNPEKDDNREAIILGAARKASDKFIANNLEEFDKDDLNKSEYLMIGFDKELITEDTVTFSQKGILGPELTEVKVQKKPNESWPTFYERGFKELIKSPDMLVTTKAKVPKKPKAKTDTPKAEAEAEADTDSSAEADSATADLIEKLAGCQSGQTIFFDWQPGIPDQMTLSIHPFVVEGLDRVVLFSATNVGIHATKLVKMDVEDFNKGRDMLIIIYAPENLKLGIINFTLRYGDTIFSQDMKRKKGEDWNEFYERGFCAVGKKAKLINCKSTYTSTD
jgi:hypothetical protein